MTTDEIAAYYAGLLILQYLGKPRAYAMTLATVKPAIMDQLPADVQSAFDLESAIGVQLDVLGKYIGVARVVNTFTEMVVLSDDDYRTLLKVKILTNNSGSSLYDIQSLIFLFFPEALRVYDYQTMRLDYVFDSTFGTEQLAEVFVTEGLLPKPMGVQLGALIYVAGLDDIFGFRTYERASVNTTGLGTYEVPVIGRWIDYSDAIVR